MNQPFLQVSSETFFDFLPDQVVSDMKEMDMLIHAQLDSKVPLVTEIGEHIINAGGKRIRPMLLLLMARLFGCQGSLHQVLGTVIEFIHTASLLHDDIVDESALRRGKPSANASFGNAASVLVGDFMHTKAFQLMLTANNFQAMKIIADATNVIAEGEMMQLMNRRKAQLDEDLYFDVIYAKTAKLFEAAAMLGVVVSGSGLSFLEKAGWYGRELGMAFQLVDDALDYAGNCQSLGKETGNDLREAKMTLPLIYLMQTGTENQQRLIRDYIENGVSSNFNSIMHMVNQGEALAYTFNKARESADAAASFIAGFPDNVYKESLFCLCDFVVQRRF